MKKISFFCLILFISCNAGKFKWKAEVVKQNPENFDEQREKFIDHFNKASKEEKIAIVRKGVLTNPKTNLLYPWANAIPTADWQKEIWNKLDLPTLDQK